MNGSRPTGRKATELRHRVFERDRYRCLDCGPRARPLPESQLEADHDDEVADGGATHDPRNYVTRCIPHHKAKTEERRMARTATTTKKPTKTRAQTAQLPDPPRLGAHARVAAGAYMLAAGCALAAQALGHDWWSRALWCALAFALAVGVSYLARWTHWRRLCEAQRVFERMCKPAGGLAYAHRKRDFKVNRWAGLTPQVVTIRYGNDFDPEDGDHVAALCDTFAAAAGADKREVGARALSRGRIRIGAVDRLHDDTTPAPVAEDDEPEVAPPGESNALTARLRDALAAVLDAPCEVRVTAWHPNGAPAAGILTYPPSAAPDARDARADLPVVLTDVFAPEGRWHVRWDSTRDRFLFSDAPDPLAPVVPLPPIEEDLDLEAGPIIGVTEAGQPWRQPLLHSHVLIAGATGAGKGSVLWGIIRGVAPQIAAGTVRLWVVDPKGGMELGILEPIAHRFATAEDAPELLAEAAATMEAQAQRLRRDGSRKLETPTTVNPLHLIVVDELAALTSLADSKIARETTANLGRLLTQGRAVGFAVVGALQDPRAKNLDNRNLFPVAIALRLKEKQMVDMVLGAGARASGATCDLIPRALPGVGYVVADGMAETLRVRAAFVTDEEVARVARPARTAPEHAPRALGEQLALTDGDGQTRAVGEVLASANSPVRVDRLDEDARVILPDDKDPVRIVSVDPDPDDPDDRVEVTYVYDGETGERVASFERTDEATPA